MRLNEEQEKQELLRQYRKLLRKAKPTLKEGDTRTIRRAFMLALQAHGDTRRQSGELYIFHPLAVAQICVEEIGLGTTSIVVALIHDVVEDTYVELGDIERQFGKKVTQITDGLTKISSVVGQTPSLQAENFHKITLSLVQDVRVILIKLADRLHNMRTLGDMPRHKQLKIASETIYFYAPIAHRLGLNAIKTELEDSYLRITDYPAYSSIANKIAEMRVSRERFVKRFTWPIKRDLNELELKYTIKSRPKSVYSVWKKMNKKDITFQEVYDLFAIRIIIDVPLKREKALSWQVYSIVTNYYTPNLERLRDWISVPKSNGYESLHTTVMAKNGQWVEVQIRSRRMDEIAEKGYAAHWKYKEDSPTQVSNLERWLLRVRDSIERKDLSALEWVDDFKASLFTKEVMVFTPMGELKTFPEGATALDFAFDIHSDVGKQCQGAKVNQKLEPISYVLKDGDQVEIITSKRQKPSKDWLDFVKTSKARSKIKESLKESQKEIVLQGKEILAKRLKKLKLNLNDKMTERLIAHFHMPTLFDLHYKVGMGAVVIDDLHLIKDFLQGSGSAAPQTTSPAADPRELKKETIRPPNIPKDALLIGDDMDTVDHTLAKCCKPIPGDDVFGIVTASEGIKVHRSNCPNAPKLLAHHGDRIIRARWASESEIAFKTSLKVIGTDRLGLVNDISRIISTELQVNMSAVSFSTEQGIFTGKITLYVKNIQHLDQLINRLQQIEGVVSTTRHDLQDADAIR